MMDTTKRRRRIQALTAAHHELESEEFHHAGEKERDEERAEEDESVIQTYGGGEFMQNEGVFIPPPPDDAHNPYPSWIRESAVGGEDEEEVEEGLFETKNAGSWRRKRSSSSPPPLHHPLFAPQSVDDAPVAPFPTGLTLTHSQQQGEDPLSYPTGPQGGSDFSFAPPAAADASRPSREYDPQGQHVATATLHSSYSHLPVGRFPSSFRSSGEASRDASSLALLNSTIAGDGVGQGQGQVHVGGGASNVIRSSSGGGAAPQTPLTTMIKGFGSGASGFVYAGNNVGEAPFTGEESRSRPSYHNASSEKGPNTNNRAFSTFISNNNNNNNRNKDNNTITIGRSLDLDDDGYDGRSAQLSREHTLAFSGGSGYVLGAAAVATAAVGRVEEAINSNSEVAAVHADLGGSHTQMPLSPITSERDSGTRRVVSETARKVLVEEERDAYADSNRGEQSDGQFNQATAEHQLRMAATNLSNMTGADLIHVLNSVSLAPRRANSMLTLPTSQVPAPAHFVPQRQHSATAAATNTNSHQAISGEDASFPVSTNPSGGTVAPRPPSPPPPPTTPPRRLLARAQSSAAGTMSQPSSHSHPISDPHQYFRGGGEGVRVGGGGVGGGGVGDKGVANKKEEVKNNTAQEENVATKTSNPTVAPAGIELTAAAKSEAVLIEDGNATPSAFGRHTRTNSSASEASSACFHQFKNATAAVVATAGRDVRTQNHMTNQEGETLLRRRANNKAIAPNLRDGNTKLREEGREGEEEGLSPSRRACAQPSLSIAPPSHQQTQPLETQNQHPLNLSTTSPHNLQLTVPTVDQAYHQYQAQQAMLMTSLGSRASLTSVAAVNSARGRPPLNSSSSSSQPPYSQHNQQQQQQQQQQKQHQQQSPAVHMVVSSPSNGYSMLPAPVSRQPSALLVPSPNSTRATSHSPPVHVSISGIAKQHISSSTNINATPNGASRKAPPLQSMGSSPSSAMMGVMGSGTAMLGTAAPQPAALTTMTGRSPIPPSPTSAHQYDDDGMRTRRDAANPYVSNNIMNTAANTTGTSPIGTSVMRMPAPLPSSAEGIEALHEQLLQHQHQLQQTHQALMRTQSAVAILGSGYGTSARSLPQQEGVGVGGGPPRGVGVARAYSSTALRVPSGPTMATQHHNNHEGTHMNIISGGDISGGGGGRRSIEESYNNHYHGKEHHHHPTDNGTNVHRRARSYGKDNTVGNTVTYLQYRPHQYEDRHPSAYISPSSSSFGGSMPVAGALLSPSSYANCDEQRRPPHRSNSVSRMEGQLSRRRTDSSFFHDADVSGYDDNAVMVHQQRSGEFGPASIRRRGSGGVEGQPTFVPSRQQQHLLSHSPRHFNRAARRRSPPSSSSTPTLSHRSQSSSGEASDEDRFPPLGRRASSSSSSYFGSTSSAHDSDELERSRTAERVTTEDKAKRRRKRNGKEREMERVGEKRQSKRPAADRNERREKEKRRSKHTSRRSSKEHNRSLPISSTRRASSDKNTTHNTTTKENDSTPSSTTVAASAFRQLSAVAASFAKALTPSSVAATPQAGATNANANVLIVGGPAKTEGGGSKINTNTNSNPPIDKKEAALTKESPTPSTKATTGDGGAPLDKMKSVPQKVETDQQKKPSSIEPVKKDNTTEKKETVPSTSQEGSLLKTGKGSHKGGAATTTTSSSTVVFQQSTSSRGGGAGEPSSHRQSHANSVLASTNMLLNGLAASGLSLRPTASSASAGSASSNLFFSGAMPMISPSPTNNNTTNNTTMLNGTVTHFNTTGRGSTWEDIPPPGPASVKNYQPPQLQSTEAETNVGKEQETSKATRANRRAVAASSPSSPSAAASMASSGSGGGGGGRTALASNSVSPNIENNPPSTHHTQKQGGGGAAGDHVGKGNSNSSAPTSSSSMANAGGRREGEIGSTGAVVVGAGKIGASSSNALDVSSPSSSVLALGTSAYSPTPQTAASDKDGNPTKDDSNPSCANSAFPMTCAAATAVGNVAGAITSAVKSRGASMLEGVPSAASAVASALQSATSPPTVNLSAVPSLAGVGSAATEKVSRAAATSSSSIRGGGALASSSSSQQSGLSDRPSSASNYSLAAILYYGCLGLISALAVIFALLGHRAEVLTSMYNAEELRMVDSVFQGGVAVTGKMLKETVEVQRIEEKIEVTRLQLIKDMELRARLTSLIKNSADAGHNGGAGSAAGATEGANDVGQTPHSPIIERKGHQKETRERRAVQEQQDPIVTDGAGGILERPFCAETGQRPHVTERDAAEALRLQIRQVEARMRNTTALLTNYVNKRYETIEVLRRARDQQLDLIFVLSAFYYADAVLPPMLTREEEDAARAAAKTKEAEALAPFEDEKQDNANVEGEVLVDGPEAISSSSASKTRLEGSTKLAKKNLQNKAADQFQKGSADSAFSELSVRRRNEAEEENERNSADQYEDDRLHVSPYNRRKDSAKAEKEDDAKKGEGNKGVPHKTAGRRRTYDGESGLSRVRGNGDGDVVEDSGSHFEDDEEKGEEEGQGSDDFSPEEAESLTLSSAFDEQNFPRRFARRRRKTPFRFSSSSPFPKKSAPHQLSRVLGVWSPDDAFSMLRCQLCLQKGAEQFELLQKLTSTSSSAAGGVRRNRDGKRNADGDDNRSLKPTITKEPLPLDGTRIKNKGVDGPSDSSSFSSSFSSPLLSPPSLIDFLERQCAGVTHEEQQRVDEKGIIIHRKRGYASTSGGGGGGGGGSTAMGGTTQSLFPLYKFSSHAWSAAKNVLLLLTNPAENNSSEEGRETTTATPSSSASSDSLGHSTESSKKSKTNNSNNNNIMRREPVCPVAIVSPCASSAAYYPNEHRTIDDDDLIRDPREAEGQARDRSPSWRASGSDRSGENGRGGRWVADPVVLFTKCATRVVAEEAAAESARKAFAEDYDAFISMSASAAKKGEVTGQDWERSKMGSTAAEKVPFGGVGRSNADNVNSVVTSATLAAGSTASNRKSATEAEADSSFPSSSSSLSRAFGTSSPWAQSSSFLGSLLSSMEDAESDLMRRIGNEQIAETARHDEALTTTYEETMKENENEKQQSDEKLQEYTKEMAAALSTAFADAAAPNGGNVASMPPSEGGAAARSAEDVMVSLSHGLDTANSRSASATEDGPNVPVVPVPPQTVSPSSSPSSPAAGNGSLRPPETANHQKGSAVAEPIHLFIEGSEILLPKAASAPTAATPDDLLLDPLYLTYLLSVTSTSSSSSISSAGRPIGAVLGNTPRTASSTSPPSSFAFSSTTQQPTTGNAIFTAPLSSSLNANDDHHQHLQQVLHFYYDPSSPHRPPMTFDSHSPSSSSFQSLFSSPAFYQLFSSAPHLSLSDSGDRKQTQRSRRRRRFDSVAPTLFSIRGGYPIEKALLEAASNILAGETAMMRMEEKLVTFLSRHEEKIKSEADVGKRKAEADAKREEEDRSERQRVAAAEAEAEGRRLAAEKEKRAERKRRTREKRLERQRIKRDKENEAKEKEIKRAAELNTQHRHDPLHVDPAKAGATVTTAVANGESATSTLSPAVGESFMKEKAQAGDVKGQREGEKEGRGDVIHTKDTSNREETGRVVIRMSLLRLPLYAWYALTSPIVLNTARYSVWLPCELAVGAIRIAYYVSNFPFQLTSPTTNTTTSIGGNTVSPSSSSASGGGGGDTTSGGYLWCSAYLFPTPTASTRTAQATSAGVTSHKQGSADTKDESEDLEDDADEDTDADDRADREGDTETNMVAAANTALASSKKESLRSHTSEMMPSDMSSGAPLPADPPRSPPHSPPPHDTGPLTNASVRKRVQDTVGERRYSFELLMKDISDFFSTANLSKPCELLIALLGAKGSALVVMLISFAFLHYSRQY